MEDHQTTTEIKEEFVDCGSVEVDQVKTEVEDIYSVEVDSHGVHQLCTACLCATRTTHTLDDVTLKQYYMNILTETQLEAGEPVLQSPRLCWECVAHLKRSVRFREQVQDSYRLLQPMLAMVDKEDLAEFLQTSVRRPDRLRTCLAYSIDISAQDDDTQVKTTEDEDDKAAVLEYLEKNIEARPSTFQESVTSSDEEAVESYCDKNNVASDSETLVANMRTLTGKKPFQCELCHKSFAHRSSLVSHRRIHTGEKPFQCEVCHKSFTRSNHLADHIRTHTGEKPYQCEVCLKSFANQCNLTGHRRTHTGERPFQCEVCHKSFAHRSSFVSHRRIHTEEKLFQCDTLRTITVTRVVKSDFDS